MPNPGNVYELPKSRQRALRGTQLLAPPLKWIDVPVNLSTGQSCRAEPLKNYKMPPTKKKRRVQDKRTTQRPPGHGQPVQNPQSESTCTSQNQRSSTSPSLGTPHNLHVAGPLATTPGLLNRRFQPKVPAGLTVSDVPMMRNFLNQSIKERYCLALHLDGVPGRYCYHDPDKPVPEEGEQFEVNLQDISEFISSGSNEASLRFSEYENAWMDLDKEGKANLYRILTVPVSLWPTVIYSQKEKIWEMRAEDVGEPFYSVLSEYGDSGDTFSSFAERLSAGLTQEELAPPEHVKLAKFWTTALTSGMGDGEGYTAVFQLFQELIDLLPKMNITTSVEAFDKTIASEHEGCLLSDAVSSVSGATDLSSKKIEYPSPPPSVQSADMVVVSCDEHTGLAKYIAVIEIHSTHNNKNGPEAQHGFLTKVLSVLQGQNAVFGFCFSVSDVMYYYAKREVTGEINVEKYRYPIAKPELRQPYGFVHTGAFQMLIMDILACLVYGVRKFKI